MILVICIVLIIVLFIAYYFMRKYYITCTLGGVNYYLIVGTENRLTIMPKIPSMEMTKWCIGSGSVLYTTISGKKYSIVNGSVPTIAPWINGNAPPMAATMKNGATIVHNGHSLAAYHVFNSKTNQGATGVTFGVLPIVPGGNNADLMSVFTLKLAI